MRIQSSIIAITTLAVLAAVITALALSSFTAEAQGNSEAPSQTYNSPAPPPAP